MLAIDGGNSKTDVALVAADGTVLAALRGPGASHEEHGVDMAVRILDRLVRAVAEDAGVTSETIARHTSACLAGADLPEEEARLTGELRRRGWSPTAVAVNDTFAVLRAGLSGVAPSPGASGASGVSGGANAGCRHLRGRHQLRRRRTRRADLALPRSRHPHRRLGWRPGLSKHVMWHAIRAEDGRGPATALGRPWRRTSACRQ